MDPFSPEEVYEDLIDWTETNDQLTFYDLYKEDIYDGIKGVTNEML